MAADGHAPAIHPLEPPPLACNPAGPVPCYAQDSLHEVYQMGTVYSRGITGKGTTIAVILPYQNPSLRGDLAVFSRHFRLPAAALQVIDWNHAPAPAPGDATAARFDREGTVDTELAHFMAPRARLVYVQIPGRGGFATAMAALGWLAAGHRADIVSFSWGFCEASIPAADRSLMLPALGTALHAAAAARISVIASSGDSGPTCQGAPGFYPYRAVSWPVSDPLATAVGSVNLHVNAAGQRTRPDTVTGDRRAMPDISMAGAAWVYIANPAMPGSPRWYHDGGTSISAPLFAGITADAAQLAGHRLGPLGPTLYQMHGPADGVLDVTRGCDTDHGLRGYCAGPGYDALGHRHHRRRVAVHHRPGPPGPPPVT
jgi:subtilase family serine protease